MGRKLLRVRCNRKDCFGNVNGICDILERQDNTKDCTFYKSVLRYVAEQIALDEGDMMSYRAAALKDYIKEE